MQFTCDVSTDDTGAPSPTARLKPMDIDALLYGIEQMLDGCRLANRNDQLIIAIKALIDAGVDTAPRIVSAGRRLGFKPSHVGAILSRSEGVDPVRFHWQLRPDGTYRQHSMT